MRDNAQTRTCFDILTNHLTPVELLKHLPPATLRHLNKIVADARHELNKNNNH